MHDVPKDVILDLLPLYLAGELRPATRAWLKSYLDRDPELARQLPPGGAGDFLGPAFDTPASPEAEMLVLRRAQRLLAALRWLFALAIAFTAIALALEVSFRPLRVRLLLLHYPAQLAPVLAAAILCWFAYFALKRRLRVNAT